MGTSVKRAALTAAALAATALSGGLVQPATASSSTVHGCPSGYVCIYPQSAGWNGDVPQLKYVDYGAYNLSNMVGNHYVLNNQTGGASVGLCTQYGGASCSYHAQDWSGNVDLTPINSVDVATAMPGASSVGGTISRSEVYTRMRDWYLRKLSYDANDGSTQWDLGDTRHYRPDCSGFVGMALHVNEDENTSGIASDTTRFSKKYDLSIASQRSALSPSTVLRGDLFDDTVDGHVWMFDRWNSDGSFDYFDFGGGVNGELPPQHLTGAHFSNATLGGWPTTHYKMYRYYRITG
jgi:hypothetical protein